MDASENEAVPPPPKRIRRAPCHCLQCNGAERDHRTIHRHTTTTTNSAVAEEGAQEASEHNLEEEEPDDQARGEPDDQAHGEGEEPDDQPHNKYQINLTGDQVQQFIIKQIHHKLSNGYSQAQFEQQMQNISDLLGSEIVPVSWPKCMHSMNSEGYAGPTHYKVCSKKDHSFLLKDKVTHPSCPVCGALWENCIDYYVVGLNFQVWLSMSNSQNVQIVIVHIM